MDHPTHQTHTICCTCRSPPKILMSADCPDLPFTVFSLDSKAGKLHFCQQCQSLHFGDVSQVRQLSPCSPFSCGNKHQWKVKHKYEIIFSYAFLCCRINLHTALMSSNRKCYRNAVYCELRERNNFNTNSTFSSKILFPWVLSKPTTHNRLGVALTNAFGNKSHQ